MAEDDLGFELDLMSSLRSIRRRAGLVAFSILVVTASAMVATFLQQPVYEAEAKLLLEGRSAEIFESGGTVGVDPNRSVQTEIEVLRSEPVRAAVRERLQVVDRLDLSVVSVTGTDVLEVRSRSTDPDRARVVANTFAEEYIEIRRKQKVDELVAAAQQLEAKVRDLQSQIDARQQADGPGGATAVSTLVGQQALFKQRLDQLQVEAALQTGGARVVTAATTPDAPDVPKPLRNGLLAITSGLILGIGLALLAENLDDTVRARADLEAVTGLPILGVIPRFSTTARRGDETRRKVDLSSPEGEAYRALRTSLQFLGIDRPIRKVQVTSPMGGEGKTTTVANLGMVLGRAGQRVVLVDCDLRRPRLHSLLGLANDVGFTSVLVGDTPVLSALQQVPGEENLRVMTSGPTPTSPPELLMSRRASEVLEVIASDADIVIVDAPPVLPVTDAVVLATQVDGVLLVVSYGTSTKKQTVRTAQLLRQVEAPLLGAVFNRVHQEADASYSYSYSYGSYGHAADGSAAIDHQSNGGHPAREVVAGRHEPGGPRPAPAPSGEPHPPGADVSGPHPSVLADPTPPTSSAGGPAVDVLATTVEESRPGAVTPPARRPQPAADARGRSTEVTVLAITRRLVEWRRAGRR